MPPVIAREVTLALGLVVLMLGSMWVATGSFPPIVVVESGSMMHEDDGPVGAIAPAVMVLVWTPCSLTHTDPPTTPPL